MAAKQKNAKKPRKHRVSSGTGRMAKARQVLRRLRMKIKRWKKNQTESSKVPKWSKDQSPRKRSRHNGWDTSGLERHAQLQEEIIKRGKTKKK